FGVKQVHFLGFTVDGDGISIPDDRVDIITKVPRPQTLYELQRFLGMVNFYRDFLPNIASCLSKMTSLLGKDCKRKSKKKIVWTDEAIKFFDDCKQSLQNATTLANPKLHAQIVLLTDASNTAVGASLNQRIGSQLAPLSFFSKSLTGPERNYSTYDRELLAIYKAVKHYQHELRGRKVIVMCDHKPLIRGFKADSTFMTPRQVRHFNYISQFVDQIEYVSGDSNEAADCLSRVEVGMIDCKTASWDFVHMAAEQLIDDDIQKAVSGIVSTSLILEEKVIDSGKASLIGDVSLGHFRPVVPFSMRDMIMECYHCLAHAGVKPTTDLIRSRFVWPKMKKEIRNYVRS
uniref:Gypsy retrotransposon integrase-like protein 1 n=1 Tax=Ciona savignyi TaxID=51511 RepID=H2YBQ6_CIOSA